MNPSQTVPETIPPSVPFIPACSAQVWPDLEQIVTEDDAPVDGTFSEKQQRLFTEPLYCSWPGPGNERPFLAQANVGLFYDPNEPPVVPDGLLSIDVKAEDELFEKRNRSYFVHLKGKPPEVVFEVVSNNEGGEDDRKVEIYARIGIRYYVIFDPEEHLDGGILRIFRLEGKSYQLTTITYFPEVGLGVCLWEGKYEGPHQVWLRWCDRFGRVIPTGAERVSKETRQTKRQKQRADKEKQRADEEKQRADEEKQRADEEKQRAERLAAQLRALGVEPTK